HQLDAFYGAYESGFGHATRWKPGDVGQVSPQFWAPVENGFRYPDPAEIRLTSRRLTNATNERSMICALTPDFPSSDTTLHWLLKDPTTANKATLAGYLTSFVFDWQFRTRVAGATGATALDLGRLSELVV